MPNYEYQCTECDNRFEIWQEVGAAPPACPKCGSAVKKIFHVPRVHFKGSGFYVTDLRAEKGGKKGTEEKAAADSGGSDNGTAAESKSDATTATETKSDTKSDTKTESTSESKPDTKTAATPTVSSDKK